MSGFDGRSFEAKKAININAFSYAIFKNID